MHEFEPETSPADISIERDVEQPDLHLLTTRLWLPVRRNRVFDFFSDAFQLESITPSWLHFHVLTPAPIEMHQGQQIDYALRLRGIPVRWQSEITTWDPPQAFVDEQREGPYRLWHHEHQFQEDAGGTLVIDQVRFSFSCDRLLSRWFVEPTLRRIFGYRQQRLQMLLRPDREDRPQLFGNSRLGQ
ncbi:MAG: SRPBCC family protein [Maioricimonas sp. JB049]